MFGALGQIYTRPVTLAQSLRSLTKSLKLTGGTTKLGLRALRTDDLRSLAPVVGSLALSIGFMTWVFKDQLTPLIRGTSYDDPSNDFYYATGPLEPPDDAWHQTCAKPALLKGPLYLVMRDGVDVVGLCVTCSECNLWWLVTGDGVIRQIMPLDAEE